MKLVHAADLHIDSPLSGLLRYEGAPAARIRAATRRATENLVDLCIKERVALLLLAGDLFDGDWKDYSTGLFFSAQMARLKQEGIPVVFVRGNHDAASQITKHLRLPGNVVELPSKHAGTHVFEALSVAVHGQSYARRAVTQDLAADYPAPVPGCLNVGLLHTCVSGGYRHEPYAPCTLETLRNKGYDYWALGHIHQREVLSKDPWVVFPGNLQGRHIQESGAKGASLIEVSDRRIVAVEHRPLDVVRWLTLTVDVSAISDAGEAIDRVGARLGELSDTHPGLLLATRVVVEGRSQAHASFLRQPERWEHELRAIASEHEHVWIEGVRFRTRAEVDYEVLATRSDAMGQLIRSLQELRNDAPRQQALTAIFDDLRKKLPHEVKSGVAGLRLEEPEQLLEALADVEQLLISELLELGEGA